MQGSGRSAGHGAPCEAVLWLCAGRSRAPLRDVEPGAPLLILEAMKMEHTIAAPAKGRLKAFRFGVGDSVAEGAELVDFEAKN